MQCKQCIVSSGNRTELCFYCLNGMKYRPGESVIVSDGNGPDVAATINRFWASYGYQVFVTEGPAIGGMLFVKEENLRAFKEEKKLVCECGNPNNAIGQGHSYWCGLYRREFLR